MKITITTIVITYRGIITIAKGFSWEGTIIMELQRRRNSSLNKVTKEIEYSVAKILIIMQQLFPFQMVKSVLLSKNSEQRVKSIKTTQINFKNSIHSNEDCNYPFNQIDLPHTYLYAIPPHIPYSHSPSSFNTRAKELSTRNHFNSNRKFSQFQNGKTELCVFVQCLFLKNKMIR